MDAFDDIVYLDVQKTASSMVSYFLKENLLYQTRDFLKHGRIVSVKSGRHGSLYNKENFYFISVREPLSSYYSLFKYGLRCKGGVYTSLKKAGHGNLYQTNNFENWLDFMLDSSNAEFLGEGYQKINSHEIGFQSFRFMALSFVDPIQSMAGKSYKELVENFDELKIHEFVIKQETVVEGMGFLLDQRLRDKVKDLGAARKHLENLKLDKINSSSESGLNKDINLSSISKDLRDKLLDKELLVYKKYYSENICF